MTETTWQPIDTAPKGQIILCAYFVGKYNEWAMEVAIDDNGEQDYFKMQGFSHWMFLPAPPII